MRSGTTANTESAPTGESPVLTDRNVGQIDGIIVWRQPGDVIGERLACGAQRGELALHLAAAGGELNQDLAREVFQLVGFLPQPR
jgi:hypothetical protein